MKNLPYYLIVLFALSVNGTIQAQSVPADSIPSKEEKNRDVMLNAADASKPREVSIGLPTADGRLGYMDVRTGRIVSSNIRDLNLNKSNDAGILLDYHYVRYSHIRLDYRCSGFSF